MRMCRWLATINQVSRLFIPLNPDLAKENHGKNYGCILTLSSGNSGKFGNIFCFTFSNAHV